MKEAFYPYLQTPHAYPYYRSDQVALIKLSIQMVLLLQKNNEAEINGIMGIELTLLGKRSTTETQGWGWGVVNIKRPSYQQKNSHSIVLWPSHFYIMVIPIPGKTVCILIDHFSLINFKKILRSYIRNGLMLLGNKYEYESICTWSIELSLVCNYLNAGM